MQDAGREGVAAAQTGRSTTSPVGRPGGKKLQRLAAALLAVGAANPRRRHEFSSLGAPLSRTTSTGRRKVPATQSEHCCEHVHVRGHFPEHAEAMLGVQPMFDSEISSGPSSSWLRIQRNLPATAGTRRSALGHKPAGEACAELPGGYFGPKRRTVARCNVEVRWTRQRGPDGQRKLGMAQPGRKGGQAS